MIAGGGNRSGKSHSLAAEIVASIYGYRPWQVPGLTLNSEGDYPARDQVPMDYWLLNSRGIPLRATRRILVVTGLSMQRGIGGVIYPKIQAMLPPAVLQSANYVVRKGAYGVPTSIVHPNGTEVLFGSAEQSNRMVEGIDIDEAFFDEPLPQSFWTGIWRGLTDHSGRCMFAMTPVDENAPWIYQEFIAAERKDTYFLQMSIHDNVHLKEEDRQAFIEGSQFTEEEREARISGAWAFLTYKAFSGFDPGIHIIAPTKIPESWPKSLIIDPAHRRPFAMVWIAWGPNDERIIYREWPKEEHHKIRSSNLTVHDYATIIRDMESGERVDIRILDPRFGKASPTVKGQSFTSIQEDFSRCGLYFTCNVPGSEREEIGIQEIRKQLRWDRTSCLDDRLNRPNLRVFDTCINSINALSMSNFVPPGARNIDILPEKLLETFKDFRDCIRYGLLVGTPWVGDPDEISYITEKELERSNAELY